MSKEDLILTIVTGIKEDVTEIKETHVTKEVCNIKCETSSKRATVISSSVGGIVAITILVIKFLTE